MLLPDPSLPWPIPLDAVRLVAEAEGLRLGAYRCPAGVWTIGWGETDGVHPGDTCTQEQADRWLCDDLTDRAKAVAAMCSAQPSRNELGALVSLAYNIGLEALRGSTALRQHNAGHREAAARAICLWDKARVNGTLTTLPGLTARRAREQALYLTPDNAGQEPMPQAVATESQMAASPIVQGGATTAAGGGALVALEAFKGDASTFGEWAKWAKTFAADTFGLNPEMILPVVLVVAGLLVIRWRLRQRAAGWA